MILFLESDSHSFGQSSIFVHASGHRLRLQSFKGPKEGSHDQGWEREWEETLPSPLLLRFFLSCFPSALSYTGIIQNINRKGQSTFSKKEKRDSGKR